MISQEVVAALREGRAVVALESTIISHGMPYPQNLTTAEAVEAVVREHGAVPATVAVIQGRPHVGLIPDLLKHIAQRSGVLLVFILQSRSLWPIICEDTVLHLLELGDC